MINKPDILKIHEVNKFSLDVTYSGQDITFYPIEVMERNRSYFDINFYSMNCNK
jgi:hypothetical protein